VSDSTLALTCARCGEPIPPGRTAYLVSITLVADFNGSLPEAPDEPERSRLWQEIAAKSPEQLEKEIYERRSYILCRVCREAWALDPLGRGGSSEESGRVH
jgi:hypothetical protein